MCKTSLLLFGIYDLGSSGYYPVYFLDNVNCKLIINELIIIVN